MSNRQSQSLLRGVGVVMDDHVLDELVQDVERSVCVALNKQKVKTPPRFLGGKRELDRIVRITRTLEKHGLPLVKCRKLPIDVERFVGNLGSVAFLLMDWRYDRPESFGDDEELEMGAPRSQEVPKQNQESVVEFVRKFMGLCTAPIFIVSNESPDPIRRELAETLGEEIAARIIVERKSVLAPKVVGAIEKWIRTTPSTYVLKAWDNAYQEAHRKMFKEFSEISPFWPVPFYKAYDKDHDNPSSALTDLLFRNLRGRMGSLVLVKSRFRTGSRKPGKEVLRRIIEDSVVVPAADLDVRRFGCGDLFHKRMKGKDRYWLLVSCDCDCVDHVQQGKTSDESTKVVFLPGDVISNSALKRRTVFNPDYGFDQPKDRAYLFPVGGGRGLCLLFSKMAMSSVAALLAEGYKRIGRVSVPYITDIRQRNAQWLQREGFPKIPIQAVR